jgi:NAD(P)-dependent dehydrogenase (short-subunit alcohol dehydrogenase family)
MSNIVVIGSSSSIGKAIIESLLEDNNTYIYLYGRKNPEVQNNNLQYFQLDITKENIDTKSLPEAVDGVVYLPGTINLKPFRTIKAEHYVEDFSINVLGAIKTIQTLYPKLRKSEHPSIVLFSTVAVQTGLSFHSQVSVSKGAIEGLTRALAAEFAPKIRVNAIAPSLTKSDLSEHLINDENKLKASENRHPLKRIGQPEDIANMANFLLSKKSSWISGQIMHVDGGMSAIKIF